MMDKLILNLLDPVKEAAQDLHPHNANVVVNWNNMRKWLVDYKGLKKGSFWKEAYFDKGW